MSLTSIADAVNLVLIWDPKTRRWTATGTKVFNTRIVPMQGPVGGSFSEFNAHECAGSFSIYGNLHGILASGKCGVYLGFCDQSKIRPEELHKDLTTAVRHLSHVSIHIYVYQLRGWVKRGDPLCL